MGSATPTTPSSDAPARHRLILAVAALGVAACEQPPDRATIDAGTANKTYEWYARYGGSELEDSSGTKLIRAQIGSDGDVYVAAFTGVYDWDNSLYLEYLTVARLTPDGEELWNQRSDSVEMSSGRLHTVPARGGGLLVGRSIVGDQSPLAPIGGKDILLSSYEPDGSIAWERRLGTEDDDILHGLSQGPNGELYIVRQTWTPPEESLTPGEVQTLTGAYLVEYAPDGAELRVTAVEGTVSDLAADAAGNVFVLAITQELEPGSQTPLRYLELARHRGGEMIWRRSWPSSGGGAIAVDAEGRLYLAADTSGTVEAHGINPSTGTYAWGQTLPGETAAARSIAVGRNGDLVVALNDDPPDDETAVNLHRDGSAFVRLDSTTGRPLASGFVGSVCGNHSKEVAVGADGQIFLAGMLRQSELVQYPPGDGAICECDQGSVCLYGFVANVLAY